MSYQQQHSALRLRFDTEWAGETPIEWPNATLTPPDDSAWVRFTVDDATANEASYGDPGNNVFRHRGEVVVAIFVPIDAGEKAALVLADKAAAIFRGWQDTASGVRFRRPPFVRRVGAERKWYHINVLCPFERDSHF